jgi:soluble lytic murein transglycosylase-like protein
MNRKVLNRILFFAGTLLLLAVAFFTLPKLIADEMFPVPMDILQTIEQCKQELNLTDVDSALVLSIMKQESGFKTTARSYVGASGLMQIMPATFAGIKARSGITGDIYDQKTNICAGVFHIAGLLGRYADSPNKVQLALAAYNGGPGAAAGYPNNMPRETINYVKVVYGVNYPAYQKRLAAMTSQNFVDVQEPNSYIEEVMGSVVGGVVSNADLVAEVPVAEQTSWTRVLRFLTQPFYVK